MDVNDRNGTLLGSDDSVGLRKTISIANAVIETGAA